MTDIKKDINDLIHVPEDNKEREAGIKPKKELPYKGKPFPYAHLKIL